MGNKVTYIRLPEPGTSRIRGIGGSREREFKIGYDCLGEWGGGRIVSMEIDRGLQSVVIRKANPFLGPVEGNGNRESFDAVCVPLASLAQFTIVEDKQEEAKDPPAAKPVQQNNQQRR